MPVLVTGAAGLIGRFVVRELILRGERVVSVDVTPPATIRDSETFERADIGDALTWMRLLRAHEPKAVIHLGAMITHNSHHNPIEALRVNVMGTGFLFEAARLTHQPRLVYASSVGVYGPPELYPEVVTEDSPVMPGMIYGATKAMNEATAAHYLRAYGMRSVGLRPTFAYGPGRYVGALGQINLAMRNAVTGRPVHWHQVWTDDCVHNPLHVTDIARFFTHAAIGPELPRQIYNVGGTETLSEAEIYDIILREAPGHGPFEKAAVPVEYLVAYKQADCSRFLNDSGIVPELSFADAMHWTRRYYTDPAFRTEIDGNR